MSDVPPRRVAFVSAAFAILLLGSLAWVFSRPTAAVAGPWVLPALASASLAMAMVLAAEWGRLRWALAVLAGMLVVSWRPASETSTQHLAGACLGILLMLLVPVVVDRETRLRLAVGAFLVAGLCVLTVGFAGIDLNPLAFSDFVAARLPGIRLGLQGIGERGVNPNALAATALLIMPLGIAVLALGPYQKVDLATLQLPGLLVLAVGLIILILSQSRSAWIGVGLTLALLLVRAAAWRVSRAIMAVGVVAAPILVGIRVSLASRDEFLSDAAGLWSALADRTHIISNGLARLKDSPWLGIGLNQFRHVYQPPPGVPPYDVAHSHNVFLQTALDLGLIGLAAYVAVLAFLLIRADQAARGHSRLAGTAATGAAVAVLAVHLFGLSDAVALGAKIGSFQWMVSGLILSAWRIQFPAGAPHLPRAGGGRA